MSDGSDIGVVRRFCAAWASGDVGGIAAFLAEQVRWENVPIGVIDGRSAAAARIADAFAAASAIAWTLLAIARADDGSILTERIDRIVLPGGTVELRIMGVFRTEAGRIIAWRDYFDLAEYQRQLSLYAKAPR